VILDSEQVDI